MRIDYGPGYRAYFVRRGAAVTPHCGGDTSTQTAGIATAKTLAKEISGNG
jgi:putative addiction module killer protein